MAQTHNMYNTPLFTGIWHQPNEMYADYNTAGIPNTLSQTDITTLFWLLYARHGNDPIINTDVQQWKYRVFSIIFQYGPTWKKQLDIQETLRGLTADQLQAGAFMIYNHALSPETAPATGDVTELPYINEQNTNRYKKGVLDAYTQLDVLLKRDVTNAFLNRFDSLFKQFVYPERPVLYTDEEDEDVSI